MVVGPYGLIHLKDGVHFSWSALGQPSLYASPCGPAYARRYEHVEFLIICFMLRFVWNECISAAARRVNRNMYVLSELFTSDQEEDAKYCGMLGLTCLVREVRLSREVGAEEEK